MYQNSLKCIGNLGAIFFLFFFDNLEVFLIFRQQLLTIRYSRIGESEDEALSGII